LWLGRNEECGLRCVYHGWKFDVDGQCVDMMNEPADSDFPSKMTTKSYQTMEMGGVIWAYMGPKELMPPAPKFEWAVVPETHRHVTKNVQECNWLQALEGGIDSAHATILHRTLRVDTPHAGLRVDSPHVQGKPPELEVDITDYGYRYVGIRSLGDEGNHVRAYHFVMPFHQIRASQRGYRGQSGPVGFLASGHMWVPMDDNSVMVWNWDLSYDEPIEAQERTDMDRSYGRGPEHMLDSFRTRVNRDNHWMIDRSVQKTETFSGIDGVNAQDVAVQESMGHIVDRSRENLSRTDMAIIYARRQLLQAARTVAEGGTPPGVGDNYYMLRPSQAILPVGVDWRDAMWEDLYPDGSQGRNGH
jgi:phenylpropionate dioxygenase-like ring-hydroxylating dioxygenase large terminal subunit